MPRVLTKKEKPPRLSAGVIVVHSVAGEYRYLLLRAYNYWDFPKGLVEPGEDPFDAAIREVKEETGLTKLEFRWGKGYYETEPYSTGKIARYYLAQSATMEVTLPINEELWMSEHQEYRWTDYAHAARLTVARLLHISHAIY